MKLTIISDSEPVIGKAVAIAASHKSKGLIQLYGLSEEMTGVELTLYPPTADCVRDLGGYEQYHEAVMAPFKAAGFKAHQPETPKEDDGSTDESGTRED